MKPVTTPPLDIPAAPDKTSPPKRKLKPAILPSTVGRKAAAAKKAKQLDLDLGAKP